MLNVAKKPQAVWIRQERGFFASQIRRAEITTKSPSKIEFFLRHFSLYEEPAQGVESFLGVGVSERVLELFGQHRVFFHFIKQAACGKKESTRERREKIRKRGATERKKK